MDTNGLKEMGQGAVVGQKEGQLTQRGTGAQALYIGLPHCPTSSAPRKQGEFCPTILIDNREQNELVFTRLPSIRGTLQSGDYSISGCEHVFAIERKSLDDLATSVTSERERFERELHRLRGFNFKRLIVIGTREDVEYHAYRSKATPKAILASLSAFEIRYDIPVVFAPNPASAATQVESWAYWFARETLKRSEGLSK